MLVTVYDAKKAPLSRGKQIHGRVKGILQICLKTVGHKRVEEDGGYQIQEDLSSSHKECWGSPWILIPEPQEVNYMMFFFSLGIRAFYAQSYIMSLTLTLEMGGSTWRYDHQKETSLKKETNLMASSVPAMDVTVSLGEGTIWLHPSFTGRINSSLRRFCRAASI